MRFSIHNGSIEQMQRKYRKLMEEAEKLSHKNVDLAKTYYAEACKIMNKLSLMRRQPDF